MATYLLTLMLIKPRYFFIFVFVLLSKLSLTYTGTYSARVFSANATHLLDSLLSDYDRRIRPGHGGPPTTIILNMNLRSMGPFSEIEESYSMQLYLRQVWFDSRLRFNRELWGRSTFSLNWMFAERIWRPDTFFINGKNSYFHQITSPNTFIRLRHDGQLYWSMRLTVRATCLMQLRKFPLDIQSCPLKMSSYGYNVKDIIYKWDPAKKHPVTLDSGVRDAGFEIVQVYTSNETVYTRKTEEISTLTVRFEIHRLTGFFLLQVYIPCILIVFTSWVAFWIQKKDVPARVALGVTTVLSLTQLGFGTGPPVSYPTAIDYFVILCFAFVFGTILEFAFINYNERSANKRAKKMEKFRLRIKEKIDTAKREGRSLIPTLGKPVYKDSLSQLLKVALTVVPDANELALMNPDEPDPGDMRGAFKCFLKVAFTVIPSTSAYLGGQVPETETPDEQQPGAKPTPGALRASLLSLPTISDHGPREKGGPHDEDRRGEDSPKRALLPPTLTERRRSRAHSIILEMEESPPPRREVEIWELLATKGKLLTTIKPHFVLPSDDDITERFHMVDYYARRIFPTLFAIAMSVYYFLFVYYISDEFPAVRQAPSDGLVVTSSL